MLPISSQQVAVLAAVIYFSLRALAVLAPPYPHDAGPALAVHPRRGRSYVGDRPGIVATLVLAAGLIGRQVAPV